MTLNEYINETKMTIENLNGNKWETVATFNNIEFLENWDADGAKWMNREAIVTDRRSTKRNGNNVYYYRTTRSAIKFDYRVTVY